MRILLIDIDSLRPDHLGCYGYKRPTSPNIDAIASQGVRFDSIYASDTPCLPSRTALFQGQFGLLTGVVNHGGAFADLLPEGPSRGFRSQQASSTLGAALRSAGYHTASISSFPQRHSAYHVWNGFHEAIDPGRGGLDDAHEIAPLVDRWLGQNAKRDNWFLHVNFWDSHTPYDTPESFGNPFAHEPIDPWITQKTLDDQNASYGPHSAHEVPHYDERLSQLARMGVARIRNLEDAKRHFDGYDTGIRYADHFVGRIVEQLKTLGVWDDTAVIVTADHGENHGELNVWGDHQTADEFCNHIPLIIRWPGITDDHAGVNLPGLHYHLDLSPTLVELVGGAIPHSWSGTSMVSDLKGEPTGRPYLILSHGAWSCQRSVRWGQWLLIRTFHTGIKEFPTWMLFDLENDPHETRNMASDLPEIVSLGKALMDEWMTAHITGAKRGDPLLGVIEEGGPLHARWESAEVQNYLTRLEATGRAHHADRLRRIQGRPIDADVESGA